MADEVPGMAPLALSVPSTMEARVEPELAEWLVSVRDDPYAFVMGAFPWLQPGTQLEAFDGPMPWARPRWNASASVS